MNLDKPVSTLYQEEKIKALIYQYVWSRICIIPFLPHWITLGPEPVPLN